MGSIERPLDPGVPTPLQSAGSQTTVPPTGAVVARAVLAGGVGNMLEWYDFGVYGFLAVQISAVFFPGQAAALLLTFATFGVGFLMRPVGAIVFGHYGDRLGRRRMLILTVGLMGGATFLMGVLPGYSAIGIWAPLILVVLRLAQGFSGGGEYAGVNAFLIEYAPSTRRGFITSFQQFSIVLSLVLGAVFAYLLSTFMSHGALFSWGWRLPFLVGILPALVGIYLRLRVAESPAFTALEVKHEVARTPLLDLFVSHWPNILRAAGFTVVWTVAFYIFLSYLPTYLITYAKFSPSFAFLVTVVELVFLAALVPVFGRLSDTVGRKKLLLLSCTLLFVLPYPAFLLLDTRSVAAVFVVVLALGSSIALFSGAGPAALSELFPARVRYSGIGIPYNIATAIFGGFAASIATLLIGATGDRLAPTFYVMAAAIVSFATIATFRESSRDVLS